MPDIGVVRRAGRRQIRAGLHRDDPEDHMGEKYHMHQRDEKEVLAQRTAHGAGMQGVQGNSQQQDAVVEMDPVE